MIGIGLIETKRITQKKEDLQEKADVPKTRQQVLVTRSVFGRENTVTSGVGIMDRMTAKVIINNAVESTRKRWSEYAESWKNIDVVFILRGYEQQGFQLFKMRPVMGNPGRIFWKLLYQMLQACAYLKQHYASSFSRYVISKFENYSNRHHLSENDFLSIEISEWESFLKKAKPWSELKGIGPNVFDFIFGDIVEARFVENSYKFDSANQYFLDVTGISQLIVPFDREATTLFLKQLEMPYSLREINKGVYTYCSLTESENYGFCRDQYKCNLCNVKDICGKNLL